MGAFDRKISHHGGDVVGRATIQGGIVGDIAWRIAPSVVGNATVAAREMAKLGFPSAEVGSEFMDEDDRVAVAAVLDVKPLPISIDIWHRFSSPFHNLRIARAEAEHSIEMQSVRPEHRALA